MADTRSLDSFQSSKRGGQASKRNKVRGPRLETLRCGDAHLHRKKGWQGDKNAGAAQSGGKTSRCDTTTTRPALLPSY